MRTGHVGNAGPPVLVCLVAKTRVVLCQVSAKAQDLAVVHISYARRYAPLVKLCRCHARAGSLLLLSLRAYHIKVNRHNLMQRQTQMASKALQIVLWRHSRKSYSNKEVTILRQPVDKDLNTKSRRTPDLSSMQHVTLLAYLLHSS